MIRRIALFAGLALTASSFGGELVTNGDFELGSTGWTEQSAENFQLIGDWSVEWGIPGITAWLGGYPSADDSVSQMIATPVGGTATLSFLMSWDNLDFPGHNMLFVTLGNTLVHQEELGPFGVEYHVYGPELRSFDVSNLMDGSNQELKIRVWTDESGLDSAIIDNVSLEASPVPEPATLTALALGATALLRRRRK